MNQTQLINTFLDQSINPVWIINLDFKLIYANKAYQDSIKKQTGKQRTINESIFDESDREVDINKWKAHYKRAFKGEHFEIEEHFIDQESNKTQYSQITLEPLFGDDGEVFAASCQSKNISHIINQRSEAKQLIDSSLDVFCTISESGDFVYVSAASSNHWGYSPEELVGKSYMDFVLEEDVAKTMEAAKTILSGQDTRSFTNRYRKKDGGIAFNLWSSRWDKHTGLHYSVARDGWEKIEQEEKLLRSEQRFKALVQEGNDLYAIIDLEGNYIYMSPSSTAITGIPPEVFVGRNAFEFIHPEDLDQTLSSLNKVKTEGKVVMDLYRAKNQNNEWRWVETVLTNMIDNPAVNGIVINSRDITEKVQEEERLKLLESVILNTNDAVLITEAEPFDEPGPKIIFVNEAFTKMTGYEAEEVIGKTPRILQGPNSNKEELFKLGRAIRNWEPYEITTINYKKSGEEFWINFTVFPVANEIGWYTHWIAIERDVTEQKNREIEKNLINTISDIFHQSIDNDLTICLSNICEHITKFGQFDLAEVWLPAIDAKSMNRVANYSQGKAGNVFHKTTKEISSCTLGEGLPGYIWKNKETKIWGNVDGEWIPERKVAAKKAGFEAMMGVPLKHKDEVIGVLLLGTKRTKSTLTQYVDLLKKLELAIGSELSRKKIEIELAQIFDFSPDLICMAGFDGYIKKINPAGLKLLGYSLEEILSRPISSFLFDQDQFLSPEHQRKLREGKNLNSFESRYVTKQGKMLWLSWTAAASPDHEIVYAVAKDITEEKKLRELNRQVGQLAKIGSWEFDAINNTIFWSDEVHQIYGTDPRTFDPNVDAAINFYREDYRDLALSSFEKCISTQEPYAIEAVIVNTSNKEVWVQTTAKAEFVDGVCVRVYGSFQDIDDRKQSQLRLQSLASNLPGVIFQYIVKPDGTDSLLNVSEGSGKIWGFSSEEVLKNNQLVWDRIKVGGEFEKVRKSISDSIEFKTNWTCQFKYVMPSGEPRTHLGNGTPTFLTDGTILFNSIILDISQEAKNEELLEEITGMARIGSWEMNLINQDRDSIYWSPILREIVEVDESYKPTLTGGIEFHVGESKERIKKALDLLIKEGVEFDEEVLLRTAKGNERWNRCIGKSELVNGKRTRIYGSYQDINERKNFEIELLKAKELAEENELKMKEAQKLAHIGSWYYDIVNQVSQWSEETYEIWGLNQSRTSIDFIDHQKLIHPKDWERFNSVINNAIEKGIPYKMDLELVRPDGSYKTVNTIGDPIFDENHKVIAFKGTTQDISDRIIIENELRDAIEKAEKSLKSLEDYKYSLDQSAIIAFTDKKGIITSVNDNFCKISKYEREEIVGKTHRVINSKHHPKEFFKELWKTIASGKVWRGEIKNKAKDGDFYWVDTTIVPFLDEQNKPIQYLAIRFDITERKKAEQEKTSLQKTIENSLNEIYTFDVDTYLFNYVNQGALRNLGYTEQEIITLTPLDLKPEYNRTSFNELVAPLRNNEKEKIIFFTNHKRKDGSLYPVEVHLQLVSDGNTKRFLAIILDITERKKAEEENKFKANLLSTIGQAAIATDLDGIVTYWNKAAENIYGWKEEEALGRNVVDLTTPDTNKEEAKQIMQKLKNGQTWLGEFTVKKKDGTSFPAMVSNSPTYNEQNILSGMIGISSDITEKVKNELLLKQYTTELERSNEELEQFAYVASHDLQEPLRMVSSFMDLLKLKYGQKLDEKGLQYIHFATEGAKKMKKTILDLLEFSRATKHTDAIEKVNLNTLLSDFKKLRRKLIEEKSAEIKSNGLPSLTTYKAAIVQILHCLLDNALKYSKDDTPPLIEINALEKETEWVFSIQDNGIGIDPQFHEKIFVIFQRLHNRDKYTGTGIGLSIAKRQVEFLGGKIWLESVPKEGTVFYFSIPKTN